MKTKLILLSALALPALLLLTSAKEKKVKLITVGDSTMAPNRRLGGDPADPGRGWVEGLPRYMDTEKIEIVNEAISGRSTRSYLDEGAWAKVLPKIGKGDYVLIQFGHNDQKKTDPKRYTDPQGDYKEFLRLYINETRERGGVPILATSIVRRHFDQDGKLKDTHRAYLAAMKEVGVEMGVPVVDMEALTRAFIQQAGSEESKKYYIYVEPGVAKRFPEGAKDDTHLGVEGADAFAKLFVQGVVEMDLPLAAYVKACCKEGGCPEKESTK